MQRNFLEFGLPAWWILPALLLAAGLAFQLYQKKNVPWNQNKNILLGTLRLLSIFLILLLFLSPIFQQYRDNIERPVVIVGVDNSSSIRSIHDESEQSEIVNLIDELSEMMADEQDYRVEIRNLTGDEIDSINFQDEKTDISAFFRQVNAEFSGQNLGAVLMLSDGIYNRGSSPAYRVFNYPVLTVGLGDSIPQKDISIARVRHNDVAYSGNEFPVEVEVSRVGFENEPIDLVIKSAGVVRDRMTLSTEADKHVFFLKAEEKGVKRYVVEVTGKNGEVTYENNSFDLFIEILESKKNVLISANAPHPDMKAIRSALEATGNYEVKLQIAGIDSDVEEVEFDVQIIFDGAPKREGVSGYWIVNSSQSGAHLEQVPFVNVNTQGKADKVTPAYNDGFSKFKLNMEVGRLRGYSPLDVPFGEYNLSGPYEVLLYQRVGSVVTDKPLMLAVDDGTERMVVSMGQGIWQWRLQETARYGDHQLFTEMIQKVIQYLSINDKKKQFRVTRGLESFTENEVVFFDVEIFDDIFQYVEGQPFELKITNENQESQSYEFVFGSDSKAAETNVMPSGTYTFTAKTTVGGKVLRDEGQFVVNSLQLEERNLTADHQLLRRVSEKSKGKFFHLSEKERLLDHIRSTKYPGIIRTETDKTPLIKFFWVMILIVSLLGAEWVLRKAWGAY